MPKAKAIFAVVRRLSGPNKGKTYKRFFKSEAEKATVLKRLSAKGTAERVTKEAKGFLKVSRQQLLRSGQRFSNLENQFGKGTQDFFKQVQVRTKMIGSSDKLRSWGQVLKKKGHNKLALTAYRRANELAKAGK